MQQIFHPNGAWASSFSRKFSMIWKDFKKIFFSMSGVTMNGNTSAGQCNAKSSINSRTFLVAWVCGVFLVRPANAYKNA